MAIMKTIIEDLFAFQRGVVGAGYDSAIEYLKHLIELEVLTFPSGTKIGTWTVPEEWIVKDAWVKYKGKKIVDYTKDPLSLVVGSLPFQGTIPFEELGSHLHYSDEQEDAHPYVAKLYDKKWGVTLPKSKVYKDNKPILKKGDYEVFIDTAYIPSTMKIGVHTIKGKTDKEILLFAHLDHPHQANDGLSGVATLVDLVKHIKPEQFEHTIKLVFCPQTIGSVAYALTQDLSNVDFMIAVDSIGKQNPEGFLLQRAFDLDARVNDVSYLALRGMGKGYRNGKFRSSLGSDEYAFNDPEIGVPGLFLTAHPFDEYQTSNDTPSIIEEETLKDAQTFILKTIEYYEKDFIPTRLFTGPYFKSGGGIQTTGKQSNLAWDYFFYCIDGEKTFSKLCVDFGFNFEFVIEKIEKLIARGEIGRGPIAREGNVKKTPRKKSKGL